jgi:hypothetical protein
VALAVGAVLLLSGFVLRGDADAAEVVRILALLAAALPSVEPSTAAPSTAVVYAVHVGVALVVLAPVAIALWRRRWPRPWIAVAVAAGVAAVSLFVSPGLHDGLDPLHEGPWYFIGLQRTVEWGFSPGAIVAIAASALVAVVALAWLPADWTARARASIGIAAVAYLAACGAGLLSRGEDGASKPRWPGARGDLQAGWIFGAAAPARGEPLPVVRGRAEGCLVCHDRIEGLGESHAPARIGCASCHGGDPFAPDAGGAHARIVRVPGNLVDARRTCGRAGCHVAIAPRVERSIMSAMAGVVAVNRRVIGVARGESPPVEAEGELPHANRLGHTAADHHLRELCVSCHLGQPKEEWGPIGEESRGGGCNACHLVYGEGAADELARYLATPAEERKAIPRSHPALTVSPGNEHCFGCHSRSSRISTSYESGRGRLRRKRTGEWLPLKAPLAVCTEGRGHARLSCVSCHSAWAPRCTTCHTNFDPSEEGYDHVDQKWVQGTWNESSGPFEVAPPTLGIRIHRDTEGREHGAVETFVPGMILTFDRNRDPRQPPDTIFRRLYGLTFAHTIRREARSCASCHADPIALGYGRGSLRYEVAGGVGRWRFTPREAPSPHDGLPADAWIGFLQSRDGMVSTRDDVRPFTVEEQRRMLRAGACLSCHAGESKVMRLALDDFEVALARRSSRCALPQWP